MGEKVNLTKYWQLIILGEVCMSVYTFYFFFKKNEINLTTCCQWLYGLFGVDFFYDILHDKLSF